MSFEKVKQTARQAVDWTSETVDRALLGIPRLRDRSPDWPGVICPDSRCPRCRQIEQSRSWRTGV